MDEEELSDASLIEDDQEMASNSGSSIIDLPGEPITAPLDDAKVPEEDVEMETAAADDDLDDDDDDDVDDRFPLLEGETGAVDPADEKGHNEEPDFRGFDPADADNALKRKRDLEIEEDEPEDFRTIMAKKVHVSFGSPVKSPGGKSAESPMGMSRRDWKPSATFFKPLEMGWVREVIYKQFPDGGLNYAGSPKICYHAPVTPGTKPRQFHSNQELQNYLNATDPTLSVHNFSFRAMPMNNAPKGQEVVRGEREKVEIFPTKKVPPQKQTPQRRQSKAQQHLQQQQQQQQQPPSQSPGLKVKMFSKMNEKNSLENNSSVGKPTTPGIDLANVTATITPVSSSSSGGSGGQKKKPPLSFGKGPNFSPSTTSSAVSDLLSSASMTITPISRSGESGSTQPWIPRPKPSQKSTLRPTKREPVSCTIHCPGVAGMGPSLMCVSCHSLFHPTCVGLAEGRDYESQFDFYCSQCTPPGDKENNSPFPKTNKPLPKGLSIIPSSAASSAGSGKGTLSNGHKSHFNSKKAQSSPLTAPKMPSSKLIEAQSVVNIAGNKFLVVPHPDPKPKMAASLDGGRRRSSASSNEKLPYLLKPTKDAPNAMPTFEVEETADGKLLLVPAGSSSVKNPFSSEKDKKTSSSTSKDAPVNSGSDKNGQFFTPNLSGSYFAMLIVFKHLSVQEKLNASRVCKMWRELAFHPSLWKSLSLKNIRVADWVSLVKFLNRCQIIRLDMAKLIQPTHKTPDEIWKEIAEAFADIRTVSRINFPRIPASALVNILLTAPHLEAAIASNIHLKDGQTIDVTGIDKAASLRELKFKVGNGKLRIRENGLLPLSSMTSLKKLSLLSMTRITEEDMGIISMLHNLENLELGDCGGADKSAPNFFQSLSALRLLTSLRLEGGLVGLNIGDLRWLSQLQKLELIDVHLKEGFGDGLVRIQTVKKLLLIPSYKDEVAAINSEIVDTAMAMKHLSHFYLGLTNEWLVAMQKALTHSGNAKDSFPIMVNDTVEFYSLSKLFRTLSKSMPESHVKILKMPKQATGKQFIDSLIR